MESPAEPLYGDVFEVLDEAGVDFVVVGGFAVVAHGHARLTVDADLVIDLAPAAARAAVSALTAIGLRPRLPVDALDFADADVRQVWIDERGLEVFTFNDPEDPLRQVDVFATSPVPWDNLLADAVVVGIGDRRVRVASIDHLVAMKELAGRPQDRADVQALRDLQGDDDG